MFYSELAGIWQHSYTATASIGRDANRPLEREKAVAWPQRAWTQKCNMRSLGYTMVRDWRCRWAL